MYISNIEDKRRNWIFYKGGGYFSFEKNEARNIRIF